MHLGFSGTEVQGTGSDDIGKFSIRGTYTGENGEAMFTKTYVSHVVQYRGFYEQGRIWGVWTLEGLRGGFQIWPSNITEEQQQQIEDAIQRVFRANGLFQDRL
jgi:hypothetical protein